MDQKTEPQLTQLAELMQTECSNMLRYACCRLGDREEARDALQDVYLSVHSQICGDHGIRILDLKSYFFRTLANHCIDRLQSRAKTALISLNDVPDVADMLDIKSMLDFLQPAVFDNDNENLRSSAYCKATKFNRAGTESKSLETQSKSLETQSKSLETKSKSLENDGSRLLDFFSTELDSFSTELKLFSRGLD